MAPEQNGRQSADPLESTAAQRAAASGGDRDPGPQTDPRLSVATVAYEDQPDRCTLFPRACDGQALLTTWLSADADALCSLAAWR